ncbi:alpha/beta fold hydrolase [Prescottella agglutinans]|uniref:Alpha/beta fold hydrolase n=1 Tax=Prescottella agglutinans TaxID=1644129 RepID=A0A438B7K8_9NOCA|nr:alpha/beta fold hydrolase [Prescottella agglutinans]RVW06885.1 alpha/beta fold hydrolase [Prescottella agglutinans]
MRPSFVTAIVVAALAIGTAIATPGAAAADPPPLPVPHNFYDGIGAEMADPGASLPGSNDWSCKPTAEHPRPVVLVHGTGANRQTNWTTYVPLLKNNGYCVFAPTYGVRAGASWPGSAFGALAPLDQGARELAGFVDEVLAATGADKVDIVGHSQGTLMPNYYVKFLGGAAKVDKYVSLAPLWLGAGAFWAGEITALTREYGLGPLQQQTFGQLCAACLDMAPGTEFVDKMNEGGGPYAPGVSYTNIATRYDELVVPYTNGLVPGPNTVNIVVQDQCPQDYSEHAAMGASPVAAGHVLNALDPQHPRPVPCMAISPFTGTPVG